MTALLVIGVILLFMAIDAVRLYLKREVPSKEKIADIKPFRVPETPMGLFFNGAHMWAKLTESGELRVGLDELVLQAVKEIERIELVPNGTKVKEGDRIGFIEYRQKKLYIFSPVTGTLISQNSSALVSPSSLYEDPYFSGWLFKIWPAEVKESIRSMMLGESARKWMEREFQRFTDFLAQRATPALGMALADGAKPVMGAVHFLDERGWKDFEEEFMKPKG